MGIRISCTAAGDAMIMRRLPGAYEGFEEVSSFIRQGDLRFVNLETTVHRFETYGAAESGGSWFCSPPEVLEDLKRFGFNAVSTCNNHSMDYSHAGLEKTIDYVAASGLKNAGVGRNRREAAAPAYLDTLHSRIAYVAVTASFKPDAPAGEQSAYLPGRPGVNALRLNTLYRVPKEELETLRNVADRIGINSSVNFMRKEGYAAPAENGRVTFGDLRFAEGEAGREITPNASDMARILSSVEEARFMADYVVVCVHAHQSGLGSRESVDPFLRDFAHRVIDGGADAVIGTGPHILRPLEIYKQRPIFYSLGDSIMQLENVEKAPADFFEKAGVSPDASLKELFETRSAGGKKGLFYNPAMFESVIPFWEAEDGVLTKLVLLPVEEHFGEGHGRAGWPSPCYSKGILERFAAMSAPFGTEIGIRDGLGYVKI